MHIPGQHSPVTIPAPRPGHLVAHAGLGWQLVGDTKEAQSLTRGACLDPYDQDRTGDLILTKARGKKGVQSAVSLEFLPPFEVLIPQGMRSRLTGPARFIASRLGIGSADGMLTLFQMPTSITVKLFACICDVDCIVTRVQWLCLYCRRSCHGCRFW